MKYILIIISTLFCLNSNAQTIGETRYVIENALRKSGYINKEEITTNDNQKSVIYYLKGNCAEIFYFTATGNICIRVVKMFPRKFDEDVIKTLNSMPTLRRIRSGEYISVDNSITLNLVYKDEFITIEIDPYDMEGFVKEFINKGLD